MDTLTRKPRTVCNSAERWAKAAERAIAQSIAVRQLQCGVWIATSATDATGAYVVTEGDCECRAAAEGDPVCKHRAALRMQLGTLASPLDIMVEAEEVAAAAWEASTPCHDCGGTKQVRVYRSGRLNDYVMGTCNSCRERVAA